MTVSSPRILVVDDEKMIRLQLRRVMERAGYEVIEAADGQECLQQYQAFVPDMVLMDAMMPNMDGFDACAQIQRLPEPYHAPVLMITGLEDTSSVDQAFAAGATDYITKPIHWAVLLKRVDRLLQQTNLYRELERRVQERTSQLRVEVEERKKAEQKVRLMLEREQEISDMKSRLISTLSHEFRTPLSLILLTAEQMELKYEHLTAEVRSGKFNRIRQNIDRITQILDGALVLNNFHVGGVEVHPTSIEIAGFCQELEVQWRTLLTPEHTLTIHAKESGSCHLLCDPALLVQALTHIFRNCVRFSPKGGAIAVIVERADQDLLIHLRDQGIGIPEAEIPKIFERFYRASNADSVPGTPGIGLGLAIASRIIELHQGSIRAESALKDGTTVTVRLPLTLKVSDLL
ncbi:MAG: hybrid sensor histidine kinase/response regulator [Oscillatoriales cyanobacterium SM2_2_1]|nr:hybrid sensor histidine kinase/response regulator [Oscillatoriales cyanobacterium SM2_2_1]